MATRAVHTLFTVGGESTYREAVRRINATIANLNSEMKLLETQYNGQEESYDSLRQKMELLTEMYDRQNELIALYRTRLSSIQKAAEDLTKQGDALQKKLKEINEQMTQEEKGSETYKELEDQAKKAEAELGKLAVQFEKNETNAQKTATEMNKAKLEMTNLMRETADLQSRLENMEQAADGSAEAMGDVRDGAVDMAKGLEKAEDAADGNAKAMREAGDGAADMAGKTSSALDTIETAITNARIAEAFRKIKDAIVDCVTSSVEFESAMAGVFKTVDADQWQEAEIEQGIKNLSTRIPASTTEIAAVAEAAGQLGIATEDILAFTEVMVKLGTSTNMSATDAATQLARLSNIMGVSAKDYDRLGATIVDLGNHYATTESEIVSMAMRMASSGNLVGLTTDQVLGIAAALSSLGVESEAGGSSMQKLFIDIQASLGTFTEFKKRAQDAGVSIEELAKKANTDSQSFADFLGVPIEAAAELQAGLQKTSGYAETAGMASLDFAKLWEENAGQALIAVVGGLQDLGEEGQNVLNTITDNLGVNEVRMLRSIASLASGGDILRDALDRSAQAWADNTALTEEAERRYATTESQITLLKNSVELAKQAIGEDFKTAVTPLIGDLSDLAISIAEAADGSPALTAGLAGIGGALGGLTGITAAAGGIKIMASALSIFGAAAGPVGAGVAILAGLGSALYVYQQNAYAMTEEAQNLITTNSNLLKNVEETNKAWEASGLATAEKEEQIRTITDKLGELTEQVDKTDADKAILQNYVDTLNKLLPDLGLTFDEVTGKVNLSRDAILDFAKQSEEAMRAERLSRYLSDLTDSQLDLGVQSALTNRQLADANARYEEATKWLADFTQNSTLGEYALRLWNDEWQKYNSQMMSSAKEVRELKKQQDELQNSLEDVNEQIDNAKEVYNEYQEKLDETADAATESGKKAASGFAEGSDSASGEIEQAGKRVGENFGSGVEHGIQQKQENVRWEARKMARIIQEAMNEELDIHSPSRKAERIGKMFGAGLVAGLDGQAQEVKASIRRMASAMDMNGMTAEYAVSGSTEIRRVGIGRSGQNGETVSNNYYVTIDAKNVKEFNDIVRLAQARRQDMRMGYAGG